VRGDDARQELSQDEENGRPQELEPSSRVFRCVKTRFLKLAIGAQVGDRRSSGKKEKSW
jgi:hypothetical protein